MDILDERELSRGVFSFCAKCKTLVKIEGIKATPDNEVLRALMRPGTLFKTPRCERCSPPETLKNVRATVHRIQLNPDALN